MANINPRQVQEKLQGVDYPASKRDLVSKARSEGASQEIIDALNQLPDKHYNSPTEITSEMSE